jgi:D-alanyl-D-alanine carboxypeptidase
MSMVNTKLNELGLENTNFTNPYGLHDTNHYTTAYDLAKIMQYCIKNDTFRKIAGSASCVIPSTNLSNSRLYSSTNELLDASSSYYYKYVTCGKTGYTSQAGECLVSVAYRDDLELICVVLGSDARFSDTVKLYEYGYSNFSLKKLFSKGDYVTQTVVSNATKDTKTLNLLSSDDVYALVDNSATIPDYTVNLSSTISAPIQEGDILGAFSYNIDGTIISANLLAANDVERSQILTYILYIGMGCVTILIAFELLRKNKN